ncbi:MAG: hypothetical protein ACTTKL_06130 [Treponema sp.]
MRAGCKSERICAAVQEIGVVCGNAKALLAQRLAKIDCERVGGQLERRRLNRNKPGIDFYLSVGAVPTKEWTTFRIEGDELVRLGGTNCVQEAEGK